MLSTSVAFNKKTVVKVKERNTLMLTVKVLGAGCHVGKSACLVEVDHTRVLFDCGIQVTNDGESRFPKLENLFEPVRSVISQKSSFLNLQNILQQYEDNWVECSSVEWNNTSNELLTPIQNQSDIILPEIRKWREEHYKCIVDVVLITHFHLDHIGALPYLTEVLNYNGIIFMTPATFCQAKLQLEDCWLNQNNVNRSQMNPPLCCETIHASCFETAQSHNQNKTTCYKKLNKKFSLKNLFCEENNQQVFCYWNFYLTYSMIQSCLSKVKILSFFECTSVQFLTINVLPAGHVPGACMFYVEGTRSSQSILYTGDFTTDGEQVIPAAKLSRLHPTLLISEGTYASQVRDSKRAAERELCCVVETIVRQNGKVLIPMSGIGKVQEIAFLLALHWKATGLKVPIILSTGMMEKSFTQLKHFFCQCTNENDTLLDCISFMDVAHVLETFHTAPVVYFCSPRSLQGGPSLHMFRAWGNDPQNLIILLGFSVPGTLANEIIKGTKTFLLSPVFETTHVNETSSRIFPLSRDTLAFSQENNTPTCETLSLKTKFTMTAKMRYFSLGSHADSLALQNFVRFTSPLITLFVHGEESGLQTLVKHLAKSIQRKVYAPYNNDVVLVHLGTVHKTLPFQPFHTTLKDFVKKIHQTSSNQQNASNTLLFGQCLEQHTNDVEKFLLNRWNRSPFNFLRQKCSKPLSLNFNFQQISSQWCPSLTFYEKSPISISMPFNSVIDKFKENYPQYFQLPLLLRESVARQGTAFNKNTLPNAPQLSIYSENSTHFSESLQSIEIEEGEIF